MHGNAAIGSATPKFGFLSSVVVIAIRSTWVTNRTIKEGVKTEWGGSKNGPPIANDTMDRLITG